MNAQIVVHDGWIEVVIGNNCDYIVFENAVDVLEKQFQAKFTHKLSHLDDTYWDFTYNGSSLTLHFNHYCGTSLFAKNCANATAVENDYVKEVGILLCTRLGALD